MKIITLAKTHVRNVRNVLSSSFHVRVGRSHVRAHGSHVRIVPPPGYRGKVVRVVRMVVRSDSTVRIVDERRVVMI